MSANTKIAWTESTWNPVTGCTKVSAGCKHCYAERQIPRLMKSQPHLYGNGFEPTCHESRLEIPKRWRKPRKVFVCSMSDLFNEAVSGDFLKQVFDVMRDCPQHTFQVLTKRAERLAEFSQTEKWPDNVWAGVSIERNDLTQRADSLRAANVPVRFISAEPLLGPLPSLELTGIDQVIVGGESGPSWRSMEAIWVRDLRDRCVNDDVAFFFKQWAGLHPSKLGHELDGREWRQEPMAATALGHGSEADGGDE